MITIVITVIIVIAIVIYYLILNYWDCCCCYDDDDDDDENSPALWLCMCWSCCYLLCQYRCGALRTALQLCWIRNSRHRGIVLQYGMCGVSHDSGEVFVRYNYQFSEMMEHNVSECTANACWRAWLHAWMQAWVKIKVTWNRLFWFGIIYLARSGIYLMVMHVKEVLVDRLHWVSESKRAFGKIVLACKHWGWIIRCMKTWLSALLVKYATFECGYFNAGMLYGSGFMLSVCFESIWVVG